MVKFIEFGKIIGIHALKGEVTCDCFFENYEFFCEEGEIFLKENAEYTLVKPKITGIKKGNIIMKFEGIESAEEARKLLKKELYIKRETLNLLEEEEGHFVADLLDLNILIEGHAEVYGKVSDIVDFGGGVNFEVEVSPLHPLNKNKKEKLEYYEKNEQVKEINLEEGFIMFYKGNFD